MKSDRLADILGDIDEKYIIETMPEKKRKSNRYVLIAAAAASFLLVAGSSHYFKLNPDINNFENTIEVYETPVTTSKNIKESTESESTLQQITTSSFSATFSESTSEIFTHSETNNSDTEAYTINSQANTVSHVLSQKNETTLINPVTEFKTSSQTENIFTTTESFQNEITVSESEPEHTRVPISESTTDWYTKSETSETSAVIIEPDLVLESYDYAVSNDRTYKNYGEYYFTDEMIGKTIVVDFLNKSGVLFENMTAYSYNGAFSNIIILNKREKDEQYHLFIDADFSEEEVNQIINQITRRN
ncbi:MAG: hypothetical protein ACI4KB_10310 [Oscillospiraceae bacterium]